MWFEPLSRINDQTFGRFGQNGKPNRRVPDGVIGWPSADAT